MAAIHLTTHDTFRILHGNLADALGDRNNENDHGQCNEQEQDNIQDVNRTHIQIFRQRGDSVRKAGYDTRKDDQGDTVADTFLRDFLTDPHQQAGTCR